MEPEKKADAPFNAKDLIKPKRFLGLHVDKQNIIKWFFGSNAGVTIVVLFLIMFFLAREGVGFLPTYQWELSVYRLAGLEFCDYVEKPISEQVAMHSKLKRALGAELNTVSKVDRDRRDAALLAKSRIEDKVTLQTEPLQEALKAKAPPEKTDPLRVALTQATTAAVSTATLPAIFTAEEQIQLKAEISALQPDQAELPPFLKSLMAKSAQKTSEAKLKYAALISTVDAFDDTAEKLTKVHSEIKKIALETKEAANQLHMAEDAKKQLLEAATTAKTEAEKQAFLKDAAATSLAAIDFKVRTQPLRDKLPELEKLIPEYITAIKKAAEGIPENAETPEARKLISQVRTQLPKHLTHVEQCTQLMRDWDYAKPVPITQSLTSFLFGGDWITNSSWQDFYGVVPLLTGSCLIALVAMLISMPFSVAAAIYTNQFASLREQDFIKPTIEFIQAIPSVVLGFIGISVLGDLIKSISLLPFLSWVPGFPVQERLNMFNAGLLLAFMAIPTMFSLAEDAINNVPRAFSEASEALGATKLQTVFKVIVPASVSGILAAMLLGLGRIIGETMVVLLVAGNRIAIPDFSDGIGTVFQPAHTLTGIIAQELGEVSRGSSHWQALFMVGILLFCISLIINFFARQVVKRFKFHKS